MALRLIVVGKTKESFFTASEAEYLKRLQRYTKLDYIVVPASKNETDSNKCLLQEETAILNKIRDNDFLILLDEGGKQYNSISFAEQLNQWTIKQSNICFVIGGAFGFSDKVKQRADSSLSLSKLTFPHHMVRTIFLEQIYRAFTILNGGKYHNQ